MVRSCFVAVVAAALLGCSSHASAQVAGLEFIGTGPFIVPPGAYGAGAGQQWAWTSRVNPQFPVYLMMNGQGIGMFAVRDGRTVQAFKTNLQKWCKQNDAYVESVAQVGDSYQVTVAKNLAKESDSVAAADAKFSASQKSKESPPRPPAAEVQVGPLSSVEGMQAKLAELDDNITDVRTALASLERQRAELAVRIDAAKEREGK